MRNEVGTDANIVAANRIRTEGRGESQPIADNATAEGRARNRRVEVQITERGGPAPAAR